jgi:hypothetical protein
MCDDLHSQLDDGRSKALGNQIGKFRSRVHQFGWVASSISLLGGGWVGSLVFSSQPAWAEPAETQLQPLLVAQQVVDGLPPPPPLIFGQESLPGGSQAQAAPSSAIPSAQRYLVLVNGDSSMLLSQVQRVEPGASVQEYSGRRFIQAGVFSDSARAQQQVASLSSLGVGAEVVTIAGTASASPGTAGPGTASSAAQSYTAQGVGSGTTGGQTLPPPEPLPTTTVPREVNFGQPSSSDQPSSPAPSSAEPRSGSQAMAGHSYYVVIPGRSSDLPAISSQVSRLAEGMGATEAIQSGTSPRGPHVRVGPFADRSTANRWTRYLRDFGMDARIYYRR